MENKSSKLNKMVKISVIVGVLVVALSSVYYFVIYLPNRKVSEQQSQESSSQTQEDEDFIKKQTLVDLYNKYLTATQENDFSLLYDLSRQSFKNYITKEEFINIQEDNTENLISPKATIDKAQINGNIGVITTCFSQDDMAYEWMKNNPDDPRVELGMEKLKSIGYIDEQGNKLKTSDAKDCIGNNKQITKYEYVNNNWQLYDPGISERALRTANYVYFTMSKKEQEGILKNFGEGFENFGLAIHNFALLLDNNLELLIQYETLAEKHRVDSSRPIVNYEMPSIKSPSFQSNDSAFRCRSYTIGGDYVYTDCN